MESFLGFFIVAGASAAFLWQGDRFSDLLAQAAAEVGMVFCTLVIITGSIWARPIWGVWWTWDPRLTMVVILWMIYAAYILLRLLAGDNELIARYAAVLGIVGVLDIPLLYIAVKLWRGIHPKVEQEGARDDMNFAGLLCGVSLSFCMVDLGALAKPHLA